MKKSDINNIFEDVLGNFEIGEVDFGHENQSIKKLKNNSLPSGIMGPDENRPKKISHFKKNNSIDQIISSNIIERLGLLNGFLTKDVVFYVKEGVVFLSGRVGDESSRCCICCLIENIPHVKKIINHLTVLDVQSYVSGPDNMSRKDLGLI